MCSNEKRDFIGYVHVDAVQHRGHGPAVHGSGSVHGALGVQRRGVKQLAAEGKGIIRHVECNYT